MLNNHPSSLLFLLFVLALNRVHWLQRPPQGFFRVAILTPMLPPALRANTPNQTQLLLFLNSLNHCYVRALQVALVKILNELFDEVNVQLAKRLCCRLLLFEHQLNAVETLQQQLPQTQRQQPQQKARAAA